MTRNQRLADAISASGRRLHDLADEVGVDPKTVERWVSSGRLPRETYRRRVAHALAVPEPVLWPQADGPAHGIAEFASVYATRHELSPATVGSMLDGATERIDVLAYAALWLWDTVPRFQERLIEKVRQGVGVRMCLGDPDSDAVRRRGEEEGIGAGMAGRCRICIEYARSLLELDPDAVRTAGATLYSSIFRFDDDLLVNIHLFGNAATDSPVVHLRVGRGSIAENVMRSFERVWNQARPLADG
jgi:transcriptional regulator with XRE-family HTH domain